MERLSDRIARLREQRGLSRRAVGEACRVSHVAVGKWESGQTENIKLDNLLALAHLFGLTIGELLHERTAVDTNPIRYRAGISEPISSETYLGDDEATLVRAFRAADNSARGLLLAQARQILSVHARRGAADAA